MKQTKIFLHKEDITPITEELRKQHKKIVLTNGNFDILHPGHVDYLEKAKGLGDVLIVGVNSDESVKHQKGPKRPITSLESRLSVLAGLSSVDYVVAFYEDRPAELIKTIKPDIYVKGGDYTPQELRSTPIVESLGGKVVIIPFLEGYSTTEVIEKILETYGAK